MIKHKHITKLASIIFFSIYIISCHDEPNPEPDPDSFTEDEGTVFTNSTDPRLAEVITEDSLLVTYFGQRDEDGLPINLTGWTIQPKHSPSQIDIYSLDENGRYSDIKLSTGENFHFEYPHNDTVLVAFKSVDDHLSLYKLKIEGNNDGGRIGNLRKANLNDKTNIKIKVVAKNDFGEEKALTDSKVFIQMIGQVDGVSKNYKVQMPHEKNGTYIIPIPGDFQSNNPILTVKTLEVIKRGIDLACSTAGGPMPPISIAMLAACALPQFGVTLALCLAVPKITLACKLGGKIASEGAGKLIKHLKNNYKPDPDAAIILYSEHFEYGTAHPTTPLSLNLLRASPNPEYNLLLTHNYESLEGTWKGNYSLSDGETGEFTAVFSESRKFNYKEVADGELISINGNWIQSGNNLTFIFSDSERYFGVRESKSRMKGNINLPDGTTGTWSAIK